MVYHLLARKNVINYRNITFFLFLKYRASLISWLAIRMISIILMVTLNWPEIAFYSTLKVPKSLRNKLASSSYPVYKIFCKNMNKILGLNIFILPIVNLDRYSFKTIHMNFSITTKDNRMTTKILVFCLIALPK